MLADHVTDTSLLDTAWATAMTANSNNIAKAFMSTEVQSVLALQVLASLAQNAHVRIANVPVTLPVAARDHLQQCVSQAPGWFTSGYRTHDTANLLWNSPRVKLAAGNPGTYRHAALVALKQDFALTTPEQWRYLFASLLWSAANEKPFNAQRYASALVLLHDAANDPAVRAFGHADAAFQTLLRNESSLNEDKATKVKAAITALGIRDADAVTTLFDGFRVAPRTSICGGLFGGGAAAAGDEHDGAAATRNPMLVGQTDPSSSADAEDAEAGRGPRSSSSSE